MTVDATSRKRIAQFASLVASVLTCSSCAGEHRSAAVGPHVDKRIGLDEVSRPAMARAQDHLQDVRSAKLALSTKGKPFYELSGRKGEHTLTIYVTDSGQLMGIETINDR